MTALLSIFTTWTMCSVSRGVAAGNVSLWVLATTGVVGIVTLLICVRAAQDQIDQVGRR